ncbi:hypothetical protein PC129_g2866 [Phytophthora cactorum]|uniref:Uncharacterized protein n=1 Tax=Phytophthora cactorum TaxID=29920 RepID=A0A8T1IMD7_9STRA|nr:hypothetical protein PC129_g2866 [Phytophthora cactorum]
MRNTRLDRIDHFREPALDRLWETVLDHRCCTRELPLDHMRELMLNRVWETTLNHVIS